MSSVLFLHPSCGVAQYSYDPVGGARMVVWWQHGAWAEIDRGYCWVVSTSCLVSIIMVLQRTGESVPVRSWECRSVHVRHAAGRPVVGGLLEVEVERPVGVTW